jgi:hypothetical protein
MPRCYLIRSDLNCAWLGAAASFDGPCPSSDGPLPASYRGGPGSSPNHVMWDLWWTKRNWGRFSPSIPCQFSFHRLLHTHHHLCMYVCIRGGTIRPLHRDPQWSIVPPLSLIIPSAIPHFGCSAGFYTWGRRNSHLVP